MLKHGLLIFALWSPSAVQSVCPFMGMGTPYTNNDLSIPDEDVYNEALDDLDIASVFNDLYHLMTDSNDCWPADTFGTEQSYGPLFIRLTWHAAGSYRDTDGLGGSLGGRMRYQPESSWPDNTNLDKARALLYPIKEKYGDALSWGDLFVFAGTAAIMNMGGPVGDICAGRIDDVDGTKSIPLNDPNGTCTVQGNCSEPLGASTVGLIYVNAAGFMGNPDPDVTAPHIREVFGRMGVNDSETVALIGGGHAFGKCHGACTLGAGDGPDVNAYNPWPGNCGNGIAENTFTSGFEGAWTHTPLQWSNEYFTQLLYDNYTLWTGPGGNPQWQNDRNGLMMLTTDLALVADDDYKAIVTQFATDLDALNTAFAAVWQKLVESGDDSQWATNRFCVDGSTLATEYVSTSTSTPDDEDEDDDDQMFNGELSESVIIAILVIAAILLVLFVFITCLMARKLKRSQEVILNAIQKNASDGPPPARNVVPATSASSIEMDGKAGTTETS